MPFCVSRELRTHYKILPFQMLNCKQTRVRSELCGVCTYVYRRIMARSAYTQARFFNSEFIYIDNSRFSCYMYMQLSQNLRNLSSTKLDLLTSQIAYLNRPTSADLLERIYLQWSAEIFGFTRKSDDLIEKPQCLNLGYKGKIGIRLRFTNPGFSVK